MTNKNIKLSAEAVARMLGNMSEYSNATDADRRDAYTTGLIDGAMEAVNQLILEEG